MADRTSSQKETAKDGKKQTLKTVFVIDVFSLSGSMRKK
jgi:hypothetical protein